jgi:hypothetical protein
MNASMNELTAGDLWRMRERLELDAATALGQAMFAFSGLDTNLGLMVASALRYVGKEVHADNVSSLNFKARLDFVAEYASTRPEVAAEAALLLKAWVSRAHEARLLRNQLVHGRWNVDAMKNKVLNIVGLPSGDAQQIFEYSLEELVAIGERFRSLNVELSKTRQRWHLP